MGPNNEWDHFRLNQAEVLSTAAVLVYVPRLDQINKAQAYGMQL